jgi:hypothetical protein
MVLSTKDDSRKILVGATVLAKIEQDAMPESQLRTYLDGSFHQTDERGLFGL